MLMSLGMMSVAVLFQGCIPEMKTDRIRQQSKQKRTSSGIIMEE